MCLRIPFYVYLQSGRLHFVTKVKIVCTLPYMASCLVYCILAGGEWPNRCDLYCDGRAIPYPIPSALSGAAQLRGYGISSCCCFVNLYNHPSWPQSRMICMHRPALYVSSSMGGAKLLTAFLQEASEIKCRQCGLTSTLWLKPVTSSLGIQRGYRRL